MVELSELKSNIEKDLKVFCFTLLLKQYFLCGQDIPIYRSPNPLPAKPQGPSRNNLLEKLWEKGHIYIIGLTP